VKVLHRLMGQRGCRDQVVAAIKLLRRSSCCGGQVVAEMTAEALAIRESRVIVAEQIRW
jgi:hypothetical protein